MTKLFLLVCLVLCAGQAAAAEYQFACTFEAPSGLTNDPIANDWFTDFSFSSHEFIVEMDPPKVVSGPSPEIFWGTPSINVDDPKEIKFEWEVKAKPVERRPRIALIVNRFSGKAFEIFLMLEKPHEGPEYAYGSRNGQCDISPRKL